MDDSQSPLQSDFFGDELRGYRLLKAARLSAQERQHILTLTSNNTRFLQVRRALRTLFADEAASVAEPPLGAKTTRMRASGLMAVGMTKEQAEARSKFADRKPPNLHKSIYHFPTSPNTHFTTNHPFTTSPPPTIPTLPQIIHLPPIHLKQSP